MRTTHSVKLLRTGIRSRSDVAAGGFAAHGLIVIKWPLSARLFLCGRSGSGPTRRNNGGSYAHVHRAWGSDCGRGHGFRGEDPFHPRIVDGPRFNGDVKDSVAT